MLPRLHTSGARSRMPAVGYAPLRLRAAGFAAAVKRGSAARKRPKSGLQIHRVRRQEPLTVEKERAAECGWWNTKNKSQCKCCTPRESEMAGRLQRPRKLKQGWAEPKKKKRSREEGPPTTKIDPWTTRPKAKKREASAAVWDPSRDGEAQGCTVCVCVCRHALILA